MRTVSLIALIFTMVFLLPGLFFFWAYGGFDKFRSPINVILPDGYQGIICIKPQEAKNLSYKVRYEVNENGLMVMGRDVLSSHRQWRFYQSSKSSVENRLLDRSKWSPILTENDISSGEVYSVFWIGNSIEWDRFKTRYEKEFFCLGKY